MRVRIDYAVCFEAEELPALLEHLLAYQGGSFFNLLLDLELELFLPELHLLYLFLQLLRPFLFDCAREWLL